MSSRGDVADSSGILPEIEQGITTFMNESTAARMLTLAKSRKPNARQKLRRMLSHFDGFRMSLATRVTSAYAEYFLRSQAGSLGPDGWGLLSVDPDIDGRYLGLSDLLTAFNFYPGGTLAVHRSGRVGYFHGETAKEQLALVANIDLRDAGSRQSA